MRKEMQTVRQLVLSTTIITMLFTCGILHPLAAHAATYYVATTGSDSNPGTQAAPFGTIKKGLESMRTGDTLYLRGGRYNEGIDTNITIMPSGTSWSNASTIASYLGEQAVIGSINLFQPSPLTQPAIQYLIFDGIVADGGRTALFADHIRFKNMEIKNMSASIQMGGGIGNGSYNEILHSKIHNSAGYGFYVGGHDNLWDDNDIYDNFGYAIHFYDQHLQDAGATGINNNIVRNNRMWGNGFGNSCGAITVNQGVNNKIYNNMIYNNFAAIDVVRGSQNTQIYDNTLYNNPNWGILLGGARGGTSYGSVVRNNIVYQSGNPPIDPSDSVNSVISNNYTSDPKFINPSANDFHLQAGSPAKTASDTGGEVGAYGGSSNPPIVQFPAPKNLKVLSVQP